MYEVFLGGYSTLKNDRVIFMYARWPVNAKKPVTIAVLQNIPFRIACKN